MNSMMLCSHSVGRKSLKQEAWKHISISIDVLLGVAANTKPLCCMAFSVTPVLLVSSLP